MVQTSGGEMLRKAREAAGLHLTALAILLKVPVEKIEALEADRFDLLPDTVFVRALAASVCRALKIDPAPILERLPHATALRLKTDESGINTPFCASGEGLGLSFWHQLSKPFILAVLLLLMGILVLVFFPFTQKTEISSALESETATVISPLKTATPAPMATQNPVATGAVAASSASLPDVVASAVPVLVPGSGATDGEVVFKARGSSWLEVVDANGVVQVRKIMIDGEVVGASGAMPLSVVVGRSDAVEVQVRGSPFDLTPIAKNNVARFEVK